MSHASPARRRRVAAARPCWPQRVLGALTLSAMALPVLASGERPAPSLVELCAPADGNPVLLLKSHRSEHQVGCDLPGLMHLPTTALVTSMPKSLGFPGTNRWEGVSLRLLAERLGGGPNNTIQLTALNEYVIAIPWSDLAHYDPIIAYKRNGATIGVRDKGPLVLVYPFDSHPDLHTQRYLNRSIWQIHAIALQ